MTEKIKVAINCTRCGWSATTFATDAEDDQDRREFSMTAWAHARVSGHNDGLTVTVTPILMQGLG